MNEATNNRIKNLLIFISFLFVAQGCQEYIHDSFDTFQGRIVNESGDTITNLRLNFYSGSSLVYSVTTGNQGEFKVVLPSKNLNYSYRLTAPSPFLFEINQNDFTYTDRDLRLDPSSRDANGVIDLGTVILVQP
ncbi:hypothetical protein SAMN03080617_03388 [Algoriphagus alkaliphilus]|uniref:Carboxypeptidase regulatory-like domain-containing protein n=1 Tax=Algoriphagus alkaliphilus TaxID=279824 RepID=A0A1G5Z8R4_9BACT|nr:hypothetical protein [Algoriphagus alkaliphilus]MBA4301502.1 hypothetical protein [Cyclobacterium sp.]SDA91268.1 hypothetical protein SAMN03080617_03388 [Algoriphagus alkaliphilus]